MSQNGTVAVIRTAPDEWWVKHVDSDGLYAAFHSETNQSIAIAELMKGAEKFDSASAADDRVSEIYRQEEYIEYGPTYFDLNDSAEGSETLERGQ